MRRIVSSETKRQKIQAALENKQKPSAANPPLTPTQIQANRISVQKKVLTSSQKVQNIRPTISSAKSIKIEKFSDGDGKFKHSGDIGDLIYSLPVIRFYGGGSLWLNPLGLPAKKIDGTKSGFNNDLIRFCTPLLEAQSYIKETCTLGPHVKFDLDLDFFRKNLGSKSNLCETILSSFEVPFTETETPWINCEPKKIARVVFARSFRYRNGLKHLAYKELLNGHKKNCVFIGLPEEHSDFVRHFGKIDYYKVSNLLEMAQIINGSEIFVGNQSSPMALAIAMHKPFIQEAFMYSADCKFNRTNANYM